MDKKYESELHRYKENLFNILLASIAVVVLLNFLVWWFWDIPFTGEYRRSTSYMNTVVPVSIVVLLGPIVWYINKFRCPRCKKLWTTEPDASYMEPFAGPLNARTRHFAKLLWVGSGWHTCASCGLSVYPGEEEFGPHYPVQPTAKTKLTYKE